MSKTEVTKFQYFEEFFLIRQNFSNRRFTYAQYLPTILSSPDDDFCLGNCKMLGSLVSAILRGWRHSAGPGFYYPEATRVIKGSNFWQNIALFEQKCVDFEKKFLMKNLKKISSFKKEINWLILSFFIKTLFTYWLISKQTADIKKM